MPRPGPGCPANRATRSSPTRPGTVEPNHKQRIVTERGYLNLELTGEDVAEFDYQPGKCARPVVRKNISGTRGEQVRLEHQEILVREQIPYGGPPPRGNKINWAAGTARNRTRLFED